MTLDASGRLGIGTTSPAYKLDVNVSTAATIVDLLRLNNGGGSNGGGAGLVFEDAGARARVAGVVFGANENAGLGLGFYTSTDSSGSVTERARIDSSGNLLVGTTSQLYGAAGSRLNVDGSSNGAATFKTTGGTSQAATYMFNATTTGDGFFITFGTEATWTARGSISYNRGAGLVAYNTTSDYRAKDITGPITGSGALIDSVPVYMGKMHGATQERPMFIAHETPEYAHTGEKDAVDADGNPVYQQMDASALIPVMWAEIQSLRKRLADAGL
jgi:hypothetical protein